MWTLIIIAYMNGSTVNGPSFASADFGSQAICESYKANELDNIRKEVAGDVYAVCVPKGQTY